MQWYDAIHEQIKLLKPVEKNAALAERVIKLVDLTSLNDSDTEASIASFCSKARTSFGHVAAVCVYPRFVRLIANEFAGTDIKTATVANFPEGSDTLEEVLLQIGSALTDGVQEVDVVLPYSRYLAGERQYIQTFISSCKAACGEKVLLKVILETGALSDPAIIADASFDVLSAGADFIKTSTGKISEGATLEAAATMLLVIQHIQPQLKHRVGIKISGGVRTLEEAAQYIELADQILGKENVTRDTFRIGASKLVDEILNLQPVR